MAHIQAALFDMDGLLFDSERIGVVEMIESAREQGFTITAEHVKMTLGTTREAGRQVYAAYYPQLDYDQMHATFIRRMCALAEKGQMPLKEGVLPLLTALKAKGISCAVASSSGEELIRSYVENAGILPYFDLLISGNSVRHSKPEPDIFLAAAHKLQSDPARCIVLEDSYNGVKAGKAAGCTVIMIPDLLPYQDELQPYVDHVLPTLAHVIPLLEA